MSEDKNLDTFGLNVEPISPATSDRWAPILLNLTWAVIVIGAIAGGILWIIADGAKGEDIAALTWIIGMAAAIAAMSIRQILLQERN